MKIVPTTRFEMKKKSAAARVAPIGWMPTARAAASVNARASLRR